MLILTLLLTLVRLGDIPPQNVGDRFSGPIRADEHIDLVPFLAIIRKGAVLKVPDKSIGMGSCTQGVHTGKSRKLLDVIRVQIGNLFVVRGFIVIRGLEYLHELGHAVADNHAVLAGSQVQGQVIAVQHFGQFGQNLIFRVSGPQLLLALLLGIVGLRDVTAKYVGNSSAALLRAHKHIDFMPLVFHISRIKNRVLKGAFVAVFRQIVPCRFQIGKLMEAIYISRMKDAVLKVPQKPVIIVLLIFRYGSLHARSRNKRIAFRRQIHRQIIAVHDLGYLRKDSVLFGGFPFQLIIRFPDRIAFLN